MPKNPEDHAWSIWWLLGPMLLFGVTFAISAVQQQHERVLILQDAPATGEAQAEVPGDEELPDADALRG